VLSRWAANDEPPPGRAIYGAEISDVSTNQVVARDGPVVPLYFGVPFGGDVSKPWNMRPHCGFYRWPIYTADDSVAYVDEGKLRTLLIRTYKKGSRVVGVSQAPSTNRWTDRCCLCDEP
jgi:hypothetical protein